MRPIPRILLATILAVGFSILLWRNRPAARQPVMIRVTAEALSNELRVIRQTVRQTVERAPTNTADTFNVLVYSEHSTNFIDHDHFPFVLLDDPWKDMDPSEISQEEHQRWLKDKQAHVMQEARVGFAEREALWEKLKEEYDKN